MTSRSVLSATLALLWACVNPMIAGACDVALQVQNNSTSTILAVGYRPGGSSFWEQTSIAGNQTLGLNATKVIKWSGDGDYEIQITYANAPNNARIIDVPQICAMSQISILNDGVNIR